MPIVSTAVTGSAVLAVMLSAMEGAACLMSNALCSSVGAPPVGKIWTMSRSVKPGSV